MGKRKRMEPIKPLSPAPLPRGVGTGVVVALALLATGGGAFIAGQSSRLEGCEHTEYVLCRQNGPMEIWVHPDDCLPCGSIVEGTMAFFVANVEGESPLCCDCRGDLNHDCRVNLEDLTELLGHYGEDWRSE